MNGKKYSLHDSSYLEKYLFYMNIVKNTIIVEIAWKRLFIYLYMLL